MVVVTKQKQKRSFPSSPSPPSPPHKSRNRFLGLQRVIRITVVFGLDAKLGGCSLVPWDTELSLFKQVYSILLSAPWGVPYAAHGTPRGLPNTLNTIEVFYLMEKLYHRLKEDLRVYMDGLPSSQVTCRDQDSSKSSPTEYYLKYSLIILCYLYTSQLFSMCFLSVHWDL